MLIIQERKSESKYIKSHGLKFMQLSEVSDFDFSLLTTCDALIFDDVNNTDGIELLMRIRRSSDKQIYLKPIFKLLDDQKSDPLGFDGITDLNRLEPMAIRTKEIVKKIDQVNASVLPMDFEQHCIFKMMTFLFTRNNPLKPVPNRNSKIGYAFPFVDQLYREESLEILNMLKKANELGFTTHKLVDRIHNCSCCHSNYINFREVCPKCSGLSIESKDLVHHFKCAHVDVIDKFQVEDGLACPKCEEKMRHIGIDYDKPSSMYHCHDCHHEFQESEMSAFCIDCTHEEDTSNLLENEICTQALTEKAEHLVKSGWDTNHMMDQSTDKEQSLSFDLFKMMLKLEIQRAAPGVRSSLMKVEFSESLLRPLGKEGSKLFQKEIIEIIQSYLSKADLLTSKNPENYYVLLSDQLLPEAEKVKDLIEHNLLKLVNDNLDTKSELLTTELQHVNTDLNLNTWL